MEAIFKRLESHKDLKEELRHWCRQNGIKVSFTVNMTFSKSKTICRKLENTYQKGYGKMKTRWLENQLKLFHFALLAISVLDEVKIGDFDQKQWDILVQAFPNKLQPILEYEAKNFTISKNNLKQKWEQDEDRFLTMILEGKTQEPKWNEIATELYIESKRQFFRNGKQCRERWLNHLDNSIKHEKWSDEQDVVLIRSVQEHGKKWSRIMKCFNNVRTQHMIKNRFLSLILRCKKKNPFLQDEQIVVMKLGEQMGIECIGQKIFDDELNSERKLRSKNKFCDKKYTFDSSQEQNQENYKIEIMKVQEKLGEKKERRNSIIIFPEIIEHNPSSSMDCLNMNSVTTMAASQPTFLSPVPFMSLNSMVPNFGYFPCYMNDFYSQLSASSSFTSLH